LMASFRTVAGIATVALLLPAAAAQAKTKEMYAGPPAEVNGCYCESARTDDSGH